MEKKKKAAQHSSLHLKLKCKQYANKSFFLSFFLLSFFLPSFVILYPHNNHKINHNENACTNVPVQFDLL